MFLFNVLNNSLLSVVAYPLQNTSHLKHQNA